MKPGRKAETPSVKAARGTLRPIRDGLKTEIVVPGNPPAMPDYLTAEAIDVWHEVLGRVMSAGVTEVDSALLARYCSLEALVRKAFNAGGEPPPAAYLTVLRQHEELLRIAGPKSRVGSAGAADGGTKPGNPFARNGHRAR
ncbi:hypothetical protein [Sphingomonas immobilis]|uniref:P27 family phage terminase small subunit n=1 Tax=Sphingomonas immobilis TaxID=3063997 RepID=A0ABT8ZU43_9SPHN|nr:hypothetical protein [Sphingomonas sp. CA1-15]MDO7841090.1 hypothetical protein [Sphingomonas sp. CA1-15]